MEIAKQDISKLLAAGWVPPVPITVKARDGKTDLYGLMFKPTNFDASRKYPIVNHVYPGPQTGSCGSRSFRGGAGRPAAIGRAGLHRRLHRRDGNALALQELSRSVLRRPGRQHHPRPGFWHEGSRRKISWIDLDRVGMYGHSGGGNATAAAMFHYPDFFKVGISESGNHDNREYEDDWAEKWAGLLGEECRRHQQLRLAGEPEYRRRI